MPWNSNWQGGVTLVPSFVARKAFFLPDDFIETTSASFWGNVVSGAGAAVVLAASESLHPGIFQMQTGTTTTGRASIRLPVDSLAGPAAGEEYELSFNFRVPILSTVGEEFALRLGFGDSFTGDFTDGVYVEYDRLTYGNDNLRIRTANNGARTTVDTGVALVANTWEEWKIIFNSGQANFYRNDVLVATSIATNIPGTGRFFTPIMAVVKSAGTTSRNVDTDYAALSLRLVR